MNCKYDKLCEGDIPIGTWNKYNSKNPIQRFLVYRFLKSLKKIIINIGKPLNSCLDVGCGEGRITKLMVDIGISQIKGCDFSEKILFRARNENPQVFFYKKSIYNLDKNDSAEIITACEVLEHLERPDIALKCLSDISNKYCLLTVPEEPMFRVLNFLAGKYWKSYGNSPGHINHWSKFDFIQLIEKYFDIIQFERSIPWLIVLAKPKKQ